MRTRADLIRVIKNELNINNLEESAGIGNPREWDSLGQLNIILAIESEFNIRIPETQIGRLSTINLIADHLENIGALS